MFRRKADKPDRLKEIDTNIQRLEDSLASASKDRKNQITQEIAKWNKLRDTLQKTFENKATCDKYLQDEGLNFGAGRRSQSSRSRLVPVHKEQNDTRQGLHRASQAAHERGEAISQLHDSTHAINADSVDFEKAATANANFHKNYFTNTVLRFFSCMCCCGPKTEETQPLQNSDKHLQAT